MLGTVVHQLDDAVTRLHELTSGPALVGSGPDLDDLLHLERTRERLEAVVGVIIGELDAARRHEADGSYSMANWLAARTGQRRSAAGARVHLARRLRSMPATAAALAHGTITHDHASVLARALNPRTVGAFERDEPMLVATAGKLTADQLAQVVAFWLSRHDLDGSRPDGEDRDRFWLSTSLDGRLKGNFDLGGDLAVTVKTTIDEIVGQLLAQDRARRDVDPSGPGPDDEPGRRRARALGEMCRRAGVSPANPTRRRPQFTVHTTIDTLTASGDPADWRLALEQAWQAAIAPALTRLWSCDCWINHVVVDSGNGRPLDVGRRRRLATEAMRHALVARDGPTCAVPGCDRPTSQCEAHHVVHWLDGGTTGVDNLVLGCGWHHRRIHDGHLSVTMVDARPCFTDGAGRVLAIPERAGPEPTGGHGPGG